MRQVPLASAWPIVEGLAAAGLVQNLALLNTSFPNKKSHFRYICKTKKVYHDLEKNEITSKGLKQNREINVVTTLIILPLQLSIF